MPLFSQISAPKAGVVRYRSGSVHPVYGLGSSWVVRPPFIRSAVAVSFSDDFGLVADGASLSLLRADSSPMAKISCLEPSPIIAIGNTADSAIAWLPTRSALLSFDGKSFINIAVSGLDPNVIVTAVAKSAAMARILQTRQDGSVTESTVSLGNGQVMASKEISDARGRAAFHLDYICSVYDKKLHLAPSDGAAPLEFPLDADSAVFEQSSSKSLHIASLADNRNWIVYGENNHIAVAELPAPAGSQ